jgi:hypothetical protein
LPDWAYGLTNPRLDEAPEDRIAAKWRILYAHLDEDQRRLWLGLEARELGDGGVRIVYQVTGAAESSIRRGLAEVESGAAPTGRVRRADGGPKPVGVSVVEIYAWWSRARANRSNDAGTSGESSVGRGAQPRQRRQKTDLTGARLPPPHRDLPGPLRPIRKIQ